MTEEYSANGTKVIKLFESDVIYRRRLEWRIEQYSSLKKGIGDKTESRLFTVGPNGETTWHLILTPGGRNSAKTRTYASLSMVACTYPQSTAIVKIKHVGIFDKNKTQILGQYNYDFQKFHLHDERNLIITNGETLDEVIKKQSNPLPGDQLYVIWEIAVLPVKFTNQISSITKEHEEPLLNDLEKLFHQSMLADVHLIASDGKEVPAHKAILASRSTVFRAMFNNDMLEKRDNQVQINDIDSGALKQMLLYMYTGKIDQIESPVALNLLLAADKYDLKGLKSLCENQLCSSRPSIEDAAEYLRIAFMHNTTKGLKRFLVKNIKENLKEIKCTAKWNNLMKNYPDLVKEMFVFTLEEDLN